jgi:signal transduction histidine kinase
VSSLRRRLHRVLLVLLAGFVVQWVASDRMLVWVGESEMTTRLQHDADSLAAALRPDADGRLSFDPSLAGVIYQRPYSGHYFAISARGLRFASTSFAETPPFEPSEVSQESVTHVAGPRGQPLLLLTRPVQVGADRGMLSIAEDLSNLQRQTFEFRLLFLALSITVFALTLMVQHREIGVALRPIEQARDSVLRMREDGSPVATLAAPDEIQPLLDEIHRLMAHVERRLQQSRTAIGNLSHALKTPLAGLFRLLEDSRLDPQVELVRKLREQADAIRQRVERELKRARLAGDRPGGNTFDPRAELPLLVKLLEQVHGERHVSIEWRAPERGLPYDREDMLELIGNLADNACKWAASRVRIELREQAGLVLTVSDDGPGATSELLGSLGTRGLRLDESRPGHGLGLAIVRDIVDFAGGRLEFGRSAELGGMEVTVMLPRK